MAISRPTKQPNASGRSCWGLPSELVITDWACICSLHFVCGVKAASLPTSGYSSTVTSVPARSKPCYRACKANGYAECPSHKRHCGAASKSPPPLVEGAHVGTGDANILTSTHTVVQVDASAQTSVSIHDQAVQASEHIIDQQIRKFEQELQGLRLEYAKHESELLSCLLRVERIKGDDSLVRFYTCFASCSVFEAPFQESLFIHWCWKLYLRTDGQAVKRQHSRVRQLAPMNEFLLTFCRRFTAFLRHS